MCDCVITLCVAIANCRVHDHARSTPAVELSGHGDRPRSLVDQFPGSVAGVKRPDDASHVPAHLKITSEIHNHASRQRIGGVD